jgi:two-component system chemotaxis response regulator CheB
MRQTRVLIVDDSVVIRRKLAETLGRLPGLLVAGSTASGRIALLKIPLLRPDVVVLDSAMTEPGSVNTLAAIREAYPDLSIVMLDLASDDGGAVAAQALGRAASKPGIASDPPTRTAPRVDVLAIAASTGGPEALMDLIPRFLADFPVPILIVQHMPPAFTKTLAQRLASKSRIRVVEGSAGQPVLPGTAWIAPGDFHMEVERQGGNVRLRVHQERPENSCRPAADVMFRSAARVYGRHVLAVVLTGMGRDGLVGCEHVRAAGGQVIVQDKDTSVVWGMPGFVVSGGMADRVLPLEAFQPEIFKRVWKYRDRTTALAGPADGSAPLPPGPEWR